MSILDLQGLEAKESVERGPFAVPSNLSLLLCGGPDSGISVVVCNEE